MQKFSDRLISLRKERGLTQDALAKAMHKNRSTLSGYETEGKEPDFELICDLARYFGVSTDYLLGYSDEPDHVEQVFFADSVHFQRHVRALPAELHPDIEQCFESFYRLLKPAIRPVRPEHLRAYQELLHVMQSGRAEICKTIAQADGVADPMILAGLITMQSQFKNNVSALLDKLLLADIEAAFHFEKDGGKPATDR